MKYLFLVAVFACSYLYSEPGFHLLGTLSANDSTDCYNEIKGLGDVNGDGLPDFMIGNPCGHSAYLFLGDSTFNYAPSVLFTTNGVPGNTYGKTVFSADWNGDGYNDIAIGQPNWAEGGQFGINGTGKVWVYWGGPELDTIPDLELVVANLDDNTGWFYQIGRAHV